MNASDVVRNYNSGDLIFRRSAVGLLVRRIDELERAIYGLLEGLDSNGDETGGLSFEQWEELIKRTRKLIE